MGISNCALFTTHHSQQDRERLSEPSLLTVTVSDRFARCQAQAASDSNSPLAVFTVNHTRRGNTVTMVQVLVDPASPMSHGHVTRFENAEYYKTTHGGHEAMSREEHARSMKELLAMRSKRAPRRGWTMLDYPGTPAAPPVVEDDSVQMVQ